jgi:hypothetical protein
VENYEGAIYEWRVHSQAEDCEENHPTTAIFYHGHAGKINITNNIEDGPWRYFIYEQRSQGYQGIPTTVDDWQDVYPYTENNHRFVFLWACMQGDEVGGYTSGYHRGMPYTWSHRNNLSTDGYADPDTGNYIFIGFENISKSLSEWPTVNDTYKNWLVFFYYYATSGYSIHQALDKASELVWYDTEGWQYFYQTPLYQGYNATNPYYPAQGEPWYWSYLHVYGNGDRTLPY